MRTVKKMASAVTIAAFLLCCSFVSSKDGCELYGGTGDNVVVPLNQNLDKSSILKWKYNNNIIFHQTNLKSPNPIFVKGKKEDINPDGSLKLTILKKAQSGLYTPEVYNEHGTLQSNLKAINLCVLDRVQKPKVNITCPKEKKSEVKFTCVVSQKDNKPEFQWLADKKLLKTGETLTKKVEEVVNTAISCNVSNHISFAISDPVTQTCLKSSFPEELFGISIWVFVGGGAGIVLVLILIVIICCIRARRKKQMRLKDERELRLEWTTQEQQQHHHHHRHHHQHPNHPDQHPHQHHHPHHHQQQPAGNTGPRQNRSKQPRTQQRPRAPEPANGQPQPSPRRATQASGPADNGGEEKPPPLPQPRKKTPKAPKE